MRPPPLASAFLLALLTATGCGGNVVVDPLPDDLPETPDDPPDLPPPDATDRVWTEGGQVDSVTVGPGKTVARLFVWGGGGGGGAPGPGGGGAFLSALVPVTPGDVLEVRVASGGGPHGGGGGASYVLRNGEIILVSGGGGGAGVDGCHGCNPPVNPPAGSGGAAGPAGGNGQDGIANDEVQTGSGGGRGATQTAGGAGGISNDRNPYGYDTCTSDGEPGGEHHGGVVRACTSAGDAPAKGHLGGQGIGNGSSGGGGSGFFGGGSGAAKITYTGGGGGGGASWIHPGATLLETEGGSLQQPGGMSSSLYRGDAARGGDGTTDYERPIMPGQPGLIALQI
ncbi:hypothetical protein [Chondromyces crocatus]|uniref:PE-PGRS family protein n=1 Tax=Chondromyces crocatus TaxID=52 RepID=A0A0K1EFH1_CHOCO|nr:hypothetical protein [Chondromyces crocatus]AKT39611.1 uncharacterized protein CMC5_037600 [Chondromyces crocatus]